VFGHSRERPYTYYLDDNGEPVGADLDDPRLIEWFSHSWEPGPRSKRVAENEVDHYWVSTVFLSIDHAFLDGPPVLWETMVFDRETGESDLYCEGYASREAAMQGHARVVAALLAGKTPDELEPEDG